MAHQARKRFGQNFLHDSGVIQRIVQAINPQPEDVLIEIGPGQGALTVPLLRQTGRLQAIEIDRDLISVLQQKCAPLGDLQLHNADALKVDFTQFRIDQRPLRLVGNLPYNISTPVLFHVLPYLGIIQDMHFMLQKEVVERMAAQPNNKIYGRLSVILQTFCRVEHVFDIGPGAFKPAPKVNSSLVRLTPLSKQPDIDKAQFSKIVATSFAQRRKTLGNNLKGVLDINQLKSIGIDPDARAETLSTADFCRISRLTTGC